jgi:hypothetical protein
LAFFEGFDTVTKLCQLILLKQSYDADKTKHNPDGHCRSLLVMAAARPLGDAFLKPDPGDERIKILVEKGRTGIGQQGPPKEGERQR